MQKPSVIIFDLGKVLLDFDYSIAAKKIGALGEMSLSDVKKYLCESDVLIRFETGKISPREFFNEIRSGTGFAGNFEEFSDIFQDIFTEIPQMIELHALMRQKGFPTYIFSNTNNLQLPFIRSKFPFFENFNGYILSYEVGAMKPHPKIYEAMEAMSGKRGSELLYIDDRAENVDAGAKRGWQVILQETPERTRAGFEKLGLLNHI